MSALIAASELNGRLIRQSLPLSGVILTRSLRDAAGVKTDQARTDSNGHFQFPAVIERSLSARVLPFETLISAEISVEWQGKSIILLSFTKRDFRADSEFGGKAINLELDPEQPRYELEFGDAAISRRVTARLSANARTDLASRLVGPVDEQRTRDLNQLFDRALDKAKRP